MNNLHPLFPFTPILRRALWALLLAVILLMPSQTTIAYTPASLSGRVTNDKDEPIASVGVTLYRYIEQGPDSHWDSAGFILTDENGVYKFEEFPPGTYRLYFTPEWGANRRSYYSDKTDIESADDIVIGEGDTLTGYDVVLPNSGRVVGTVVNADGVGIAGVEVALWQNIFEYAPFVSTTTGGDGHFELIAPQELGNVLFFDDSSGVYVDEYYDNEFFSAYDADKVVVPAETVITVTVQLDPPPSIRGTVTDNQGKPVSNVTVALFKGDSTSPQANYPTDQNGFYSATGLAIDTYRIQFAGSVSLPEYYPNQNSLETAQVIDFTSDLTPVVADAVVTRTGSVSGTVMSLQGDHLENVVVRLRYKSNDSLRTAASTITDSDGNYIINGLPGVAYWVEFVKDDYEGEYYDNAIKVEDAISFTLPVETTMPNINASLRLVHEVEAVFVGAPLTGTVPLTVDFTDQSQGGVLTEQWHFGDGSTSSEINATHTYTASGVYTVTLIVMGTVNTHTLTETSYITVSDMPIVDLQMEQSMANGDPAATPAVGEMLYFSATAGGTGVQYLWDFGDEAALVASVATTATGQYVQHAYAAAGTYTVTLTASNSEGEQSTTQAVTVVVAASEESTLLLPKLER